MAQRSRHSAARKKKKHIFPRLLIFALICAIALFFVTDYYEETKENLKKINHPLKYSEYVEKAAEEYNLDQALIYAVIRTESNFNENAESPVGACGIMQIMPSSFEWLQNKRGETENYTTEDLFNPEICIDYGAYLLRYFYDRYGTEKSAVAAYNAGFVVGDWLDDSRYSEDGKNLSDIPYPETKKYVEKVEKSKQMYTDLYFSQNTQGHD